VETIGLSINGKNLTCKSDISILEAASQNGFSIPTLCHHPDLKPHGACRLCLVEDAVTGRLYASCVTPVSEGLSVLTHTPRIMEHRKTIASLIMAAHPESCLVCSKGNACMLRKIATEMGLGQQRLYPMPKYSPQDQSNPFIFRDISKCILCGKCIRGCKELVVNGTLEYSNRGFDSMPLTVLDTPLAGSDCLFCGTCVSLCPTGALVQSSSVYTGTALDRRESVCGFCGAGCSISIGVNGNRVTDVQPSEKKDTVNGVTLCVRGHFGLDFLESKGRLLNPMAGRGDDRTALSWDDALSRVAGRFAEIRDRFGPGSIGFYGSSKCSNEENYLFQKIARAALGTNHIDNGGFVYGRPGMGLIDKLTSGYSGKNPFADLEKAQVILVAGADPGNSVPVLNYHIKRAAKKGSALIVVGHRYSDLVMHGNMWLRPGSGKDLVGFYRDMAQGISACLDQGTGRDLSSISERTGVTESLFREAAQLMSNKRTAFVVGNEILAQAGGESAITAWVRLAGVAECLGSRGGGIYPVVRENNLMGSWDMGTVPEQLPGRIDILDKDSRLPFESYWNVSLQASPGMNILQMIGAAEKGDLKAMYVMGENPVRSLAQSKRVQKALEGLEFLAVQDILETETTALAHLVLPGAAFLEKKGSFTNMEGRVQSVERVLTPPGQAKSDFVILSQVASGLGLTGNSLGDIRREIETLVPAYQGLAQSSSLWRENIWTGKDEPPPMEVTGTEGPDKVKPHKDYPLTAVIVDSYFQAGCGTRTGYSTRINRAQDPTAQATSLIHMSKNLARMMGLDDGSRIRVISPHGSVSRSMACDPDMSDDMLYIPRAFEANDVMNLFDLKLDETSVLSGWKQCRVRIEK